jgi:hypothetical protein
MYPMVIVIKRPYICVDMVCCVSNIWRVFPYMHVYTDDTIQSNENSGIPRLPSLRLTRRISALL